MDFQDYRFQFLAKVSSGRGKNPGSSPAETDDPGIFVRGGYNDEQEWPFKSNFLPSYSRSNCG